MDSTLLDQIRHLCRDRAAYEHLKAILVQQERVHQLSWEERYEKLMSAQASDQQTDLFRNIIAREKSLAQLADAIQRSQSLELVLQVAVQVTQKLLQVDRVAIFRRYPDGRGEFVTDAIASGLMSLVDMPERQLTLAKHMIESTEVEEHSNQTVDSIRSSSLSSHIVTLLEQIGISSYAVNKIYAGQEVWGTLVAFHGSAYHSWSESDRTSLSLIASQIGIAISLTNLRQQSQDLTQDLEDLQSEITLLQQAVKEISQQEVESFIADNEPLKPEFETPTEEIVPTEPIELVSSSLIEDAENLVEVNEIIESTEDNDNDDKNIEQPAIPTSLESLNHEESQENIANQENQDLTENLDNALDENLEETEDRDNDSLNVEQAQQILNVALDPIEQHLEDNPEEILYSGYIPISNNGVPALFLLQNPLTDLSDDDLDSEEDSSEGITPISTETVILEITNDQEPINVFREEIEAENIATTEEESLESPIPDTEAAIKEIVTDTINSSVEENVSAVVEKISEHEELEPEISSSAEDLSKSTEPEPTELDPVAINPETEHTERADPSETLAIANVSGEPEKSSEEFANVEAEELNRSDITSENELSDQVETVEQVVEQVESEEIAQEITEAPQNAENPDSNTETLQEDRKDEEDAHQEGSTASQVQVPDQPTPDDLTTIIIDPDEERDPAIEPQFIETILAISGNDSKGIKFLLGVIDTYLEDTPKLVQSIDKAIASNDHPKVLQLINTLRISSDYIGALALSYQCRQLESAVRANYVVLIYACLSQVAIEAQRATDALRIEREKYSE
jgi:GAF domain-containing protein